MRGKRGVREQQHKPTPALTPIPTPIPIPIPIPTLIPSEERLQKREGERPDPIAGKTPNLRASRPAQPLLWVLLSLGKPKIPRTDQAGSKVAKCDLRGARLSGAGIPRAGAAPRTGTDSF